ncbi:hypothetical protein PROSTU_03180 [Providencia stuartii ATCC 25827]|uniref:Uncharacterized protein n=1 Tax=Providencia stuartii ATCC 25827 TaxID=471874 RepID=A0AA87CTM1_PROST|nr:hypothetical protein PROSTU_03180 [Providencia stuartii ATCC 25827]
MRYSEGVFLFNSLYFLLNSFLLSLIFIKLCASSHFLNVAIF